MGELERGSDWSPLSETPAAEAGAPGEPHRELLRVRLDRGEEVVFELCTRDQLHPQRWAGAVDLVVWHPETRDLVLRASLDEELLTRATRGEEGACLVYAHAQELQVGGIFAIEAVWPDRELPEAVRRVPVRARVIAQRQMSPSDRWVVVLVMVGSLLLALGVTRWKGGRRRKRKPRWDEIDAEDGDPSEDGLPRDDRGGGEASSLSDPQPTRSGRRGALLDVARLVAGVALLLGGGLALGLVPIWGSVAGLGRGVLLAAVQIGIAVALVRGIPSGDGGRQGALALVPPPRARWLLWLAPAFGVLLWLAGRLLLSVVPSTSEAPIETLVAWPSGQLAVSLAGVLVPIAEELFFRGFVYGTAERRFGRAAAFLITVVLFTLAHLPQVWGAWGGLAAIMATGIGLTALRLWSGSTTVPALAHVVHNGAISILAAVLTSSSG